jgi:hypothetical protein
MGNVVFKDIAQSPSGPISIMRNLIVENIGNITQNNPIFSQQFLFFDFKDDFKSYRSKRIRK